MPTYEYECMHCGLHLEKEQKISDAPLSECPECKGEIRRLISGGSGFILKSPGRSPHDSGKSCSLTETGKTCCGASQRCGQASCGD